MAPKLHSELILDILSRLPVKCLARFRCVSKVWCGYIGDNHFNKIHHGQRSHDEPLIMVTLQDHKEPPSIGVYAIETKQDGTADHPVLKAEKILSLDYTKYKHYSGLSTPHFLGSCNGLVYLARNWMEFPSCFIVVNPLRKEYFDQLPPIEPIAYQLYMFEHGAHGLGFDDLTNTFKMVFFAKTQTEPPTICPLLHVFGTNSWRKVSHFPLDPMLTNDYTMYRSQGVFSGGCLHWLAYVRRVNEEEKKIISLDMRTEEFRLTDLPKKHGPYGERLVDLNGEVGYVSTHENNCFEVWVLKQKEWVIHCRFDPKPPLPASNEGIEVIGCWNKDGDILMQTRYCYTRREWFIYCVKSGLLEEVELAGDDICNTHKTLTYPCSLFSIHDIKTYSIKSDDSDVKSTSSKSTLSSKSTSSLPPAKNLAPL